MSLPEGDRSAFVLSGTLRRQVVPVQMRTRHPVGARSLACPGAVSNSNRLGGHCRGGRPACPSETLKSAGRIRESAGRSGLVGFPATAAVSVSAWERDRTATVTVLDTDAATPTVHRARARARAWFRTRMRIRTERHPPETASPSSSGGVSSSTPNENWLSCSRLTNVWPQY